MNRDQHWLEQLFQAIWQRYFPDVKAKTPVQIKFGKRARNRLGSLSYDPRTKIATVRLTKLFADPQVPEMIIKATIVHELCHYAHGFSGGGRPRFKYPHAGGVIRREFAERGLESLYESQKAWLKAHWPAIVGKHFPKLTRRRSIRVRYRLI